MTIPILEQLKQVHDDDFDTWHRVAAISIGKLTCYAMHRLERKLLLGTAIDGSTKLLQGLDSLIGAVRKANRLAGMPYKEYLKTPEWQETREIALKLANYRCQKCGTGDELEVHHLTYKRRGQEEASDLLVLCDDCHKKEHLSEVELVHG